MIGREKEVKELQQVTNKKQATLIVLRGRRRIGKSTLLQTFGRSYGNFIEISGLAPAAGLGPEHQLENFSEQLSLAVGIPGFKFSNWNEAFTALAGVSKKTKTFILLDEISWMSAGDPTFAGKLKIVWDKEFSQIPNLVLALCGSVSSWIEANILNSTDFVGRVSWQKNLGPMPLKDCSQFWGKRKISPKEKLTFLSISGGVPKYLAEMDPGQTAEQNIKRLAFEPSGYLFNDFEKIFKDIFSMRANAYQNIALQLVNGKLTPKEIAERLDQAQSGNITRYIDDMEQAGFLRREFGWEFDSSKKSKLSYVTIADNYLRFYLRYVLPNIEKIESQVLQFQGVDKLKGWDSIVGLQIENLVLANSLEILDRLNLPIEDIEQFGPYFQTKTAKREGCQIDLLVQCKRKQLFVFEVKFREKIGMEVVHEVSRKIERLKTPKHYSLRPFLIFSGSLSKEVMDSDFFEGVFDLEELLDSSGL